MLAFDDYRRHDGLGLAALVRQGEISTADLLETAIAAAERLDPAINALSQKFYDEARASLAGVDAGAPFGDEATLFRLAAQLEQAKPWFDKVPAL